MQPLLITGEMRSGTTFLANFLNSQKGIDLYADMLVSLFMEAHNMQIATINRQLSDKEKNVLLSNIIQEGKIQKIDFSIMDRTKPHTWLSLFIEALQVLKTDDSMQFVGVKRTREELYLPQLLESNVKIIYCVRDPRDVVISASNRFGSFDLFKAIDNWRKSIDLASELNGHPNFIILKYEDVILKKEEIAEELGSFLGIKLTTDLHRFKYRNDMEYRDNSSFGDVKKLFDPTAVYRWKSKPPIAEISFAEKLLGTQMMELNYEKSQDVGIDIQGVNRLLKAYRGEKRKENFKNGLKIILGRWI